MEQTPAVPNLEQQPSIEKPKGNRVVALMVIIVVLLLGAVGILGYQNLQLQKQLISLQPTPSPSATSDPTADWKTYTSQDYGFELRYPTDWEARQGKDAEGKPIGQFSWSVPASLKKVSAFSLTLSIVNTNESTAEAFVQAYIAAGGPGKIEYRAKSEVTIGGVTGVKLESVFAFDKSQDQIYLLHNGKIYEFILPIRGVNPNITDAVKNNPIAYQILSTFKFIDQTTDTSNWKIYTNTSGYSIKYPTSFTTGLQTAGAGNIEASPTAGNLFIYKSGASEPYVERYINLEVFQMKPTYNQGTVTEAKLDNQTVEKIMIPGSKFDIYSAKIGTNGFIEIYVSNDSTKKETANQILSTFKFTNITSDANNDQVRQAAINYLKSTGVSDPVINSITLLGNYKDKYVVGFIPSKDYSGGGNILLVGKVNNEWIIPSSGNSNYCNWIKNSGADEATQAFLGPTCK